MATTLVTWNLKGAEDPDVRAVVDHLRAEGADLVCLQEVQWHQARRIARALDARSWAWSFKHWPVRTWPEGMAILGVGRPVRVRARALTAPRRVWSWRRRIVQVGTVDGATPLTVVNLHLSPDDLSALRAVEVATVLDLVAGVPGPVVVCGDLNERPGGGLHDRFAAAGLRDATANGVADGPDAPTAPGSRRGADPLPTNWRGWRRGTTEPPTQQLDFVYVGEGVEATAVRVPRGDGAVRFAAISFAAISDHLPVTAVLEVDGRAG
ncbi:MAG TPA: endonuclease/exonuclease/phosphatase family protein [Acidimicrobiales bacterium]|nr:endonuclease/exonuclease/phosphatase family protein [Acidimicrobiales bacterium]